VKVEDTRAMVPRILMRADDLGAVMGGRDVTHEENARPEGNEDDIGVRRSKRERKVAGRRQEGGTRVGGYLW
jgi:hypothetical protein